MKLSELVQEAWPEHEAQTALVAERLEAAVELVQADDPDGVTAFLNLVNHTIGDHIGDRERALLVCEAAFARLTEHGNKSAWLHLAVARHLAGEEEAAHAAENELGDAATGQVRVRLLVAQGKAHAQEWGAAAQLYQDCLHVAEGLAPGHKAEQATAIVSNNLASALLALEERDEAQDALMERAAEAARAFWLRVGDWTNDERADYLLSSVKAALGRGQEARELAERGLATIAANGEENIDQAFLELARARGCKLAGDMDEHRLSVLRAQALSDEFEGEGLTKWFEKELAKARA